MSPKIKNAIPIYHHGVLTALRVLARDERSLAVMMDVATDQATLLRQRLRGPVEELPTQLTSLIPSIVVEHIERLPTPGLLFWAKGRWHIHVRKGDPVRAQAHATLHQLKHIVDHPLRRAGTALETAEWERLAEHFAEEVLANIPGKVRL